MSDELPIDVITTFTVAVSLNGEPVVYLSEVPAMNVGRVATLDDIEMYSQHLANAAGRAITMKVLMPQPEVTPADKVAEALAKRAGD